MRLSRCLLGKLTVSHTIRSSALCFKRLANKNKLFSSHNKLPLIGKEYRRLIGIRYYLSFIMVISRCHVCHCLTCVEMPLWKKKVFHLWLKSNHVFQTETKNLLSTPDFFFLDSFYETWTIYQLLPSDHPHALFSFPPAERVTHSLYLSPDQLAVKCNGNTYWTGACWLPTLWPRENTQSISLCFLSLKFTQMYDYLYWYSSSLLYCGSIVWKQQHF